MRIGLDLGGTKIEVLALAPGGRELFRRRVAAPRDGYQVTIRAIIGLIAAAEAKTGRTGTLRIGTPGTSSPATGLLRNSNSTWLNGRPLKSDLESALGRPVRMENDANCLAPSEAIDGAGAGSRVVFGVIIGTGTGGGIVVDRRVLSGPNAIAGEWGHNPLPWSRDDERPGHACYCGRTGCIETFLSGPGMTRDHATATGETLDAAEFARLASTGDSSATATVTRYTERMAKGLSSRHQYSRSGRDRARRRAVGDPFIL